MDRKRLAQMRRKLEVRRAELAEDIERLEAKVVELGVDQDQEGGVGDDGASLGEQQVISSLSGDFQDLIADIDAALGRIEDGTYGVCQRCGESINDERLEAIPYVAHCVNCQEHLERQIELFGAPVSG